MNINSIFYLYKHFLIHCFIYSPQYPCNKKKKAITLFFYFPDGTTIVQEPTVIWMVSGLGLNLGIALSQYIVNNVMSLALWPRSLCCFCQ